MTRSMETHAGTVAPMARSAVYRMLAAAFRYPSPELFRSHQEGTFWAELGENLSRLPHPRPVLDEEARLRHDLADLTFRDFESGYTQTFDAGAPKPPCPPYEGLHRQGLERTHLMVEISEFYKHFGLGMSEEEGKRELPDHLSAELELLHFLTFKEAQAEREGTTELLRGYVLAQRDFLERHMVSWLPRFCETLERSARVPLYSDLARVTREFAESDLEWTRSRLQELDEP